MPDGLSEPRVGKAVGQILSFYFDRGFRQKIIIGSLFVRFEQGGELGF